MRRGSVLVLLAALACAGCKKAEQAERKGPLVVAEQPPLPEDPERGKRSTEQWKKHLQKEEDERQALFDRLRLDQHRAAIRLLASARKALDEAGGRQELTAAQAAVNGQLGELRERLTQLDPWGNSSRLLSDYDALHDLLASRYGEARKAAFRGDGQPLTAARNEFDAHVRAMQGWLVRVQNEEEDEDE
jgi:hypothetical protein